VRGGLGEIDEVLVQDSAHAVAGAIDLGDLRKLARLENHTHETLIDDGGGTTSLGDQGFSGQFRHWGYSS
jgi:hypothetical protein